LITLTPEFEIPNRVELDIELQRTDEYPDSAFIQCDFDVFAVFGSKARVPVVLSVDGHRFRSSLAPMGGRHMMVFNREMRAATGYKAGDRIQAVLERDFSDRQVDVPLDVRTAIEAAGLWDAYERQSYSHRKEQMQWIAEAKKPETRARRIDKLLSEYLPRRLNR